jgi:hypothetical protein
MIKNNIKLIIEKLIAKTDSGQAIWKKTSRDTEFKLELSKGAITTDCWVDVDSLVRWVDFSVYNSNGEIIERDYFHENQADDYAVLHEVYESVKRSYYKIDETFKIIFDELDGDEKIGGESKDLPF